VSARCQGPVFAMDARDAPRRPLLGTRLRCARAVRVRSVVVASCRFADDRVGHHVSTDRRPPRRRPRPDADSGVSQLPTTVTCTPLHGRC
jgi:hypothetical protein